MEPSIQPPTPTASPESENPSVTSFAAKLSNIFVAPGEVFEEIRIRAVATVNWVVPLILAVVVGVVFVCVIFSQPGVLRKTRQAQEDAFQKQVKAGKMTQQQADQAAQMLEKFMGPTVLKVIGSVSSAGVTVAWLFVGGMVFWAAGRLVFKADLEYLKAVEAVALASIIGVLDSIIKMLLVLLTDDLGVNLGPVMFLRPFDPLNKMHVILAAINLMTFWHLAVLAIGLSRLARVSWGKAVAVVYAAWAVLAFLSLLPALLR